MTCVVNRCSLQSWSANVDGNDTCCYALQQGRISFGPRESSHIEAVSSALISCHWHILLTRRLCIYAILWLFYLLQNYNYSRLTTQWLPVSPPLATWGRGSIGWRWSPSAIEVHCLCHETMDIELLHLVCLFSPAFASTNLYYLMAGAYGCEQLAQSHYASCALGPDQQSNPRSWL